MPPSGVDHTPGWRKYTMAIRLALTRAASPARLRTRSCSGATKRELSERLVGAKIAVFTVLTGSFEVSFCANKIRAVPSLRDFAASGGVAGAIRHATRKGTSSPASPSESGCDRVQGQADARRYLAIASARSRRSLHDDQQWNDPRNSSRSAAGAAKGRVRHSQISLRR